MANQTVPIRGLLACGAVAGPLYVTVTMAQALTRDGFDFRQHRFTYLTTGDFGWVHQSNMLVVGILTVLAAVGVRETLRTAKGGVWGPRLLARTSAGRSRSQQHSLACRARSANAGHRARPGSTRHSRLGRDPA